MWIGLAEKLLADAERHIAETERNIALTRNNIAQLEKALLGKSETADSARETLRSMEMSLQRRIAERRRLLGTHHSNASK
jgi:septation ring formation regulator EzrA